MGEWYLESALLKWYYTVQLTLKGAHNLLYATLQYITETKGQASKIITECATQQYVSQYPALFAQYHPYNKGKCAGKVEFDMFLNVVNLLMYQFKTVQATKCDWCQF